EGLEGLLRMPFGCGEQNMILFAPNVFVTNYLKETGQMKPEVMAKAETLMVTGYQRELTYRRGDGSFSAFGNQDKEGSLWLTAFVLKTFSQAKGTIYIDDAVLSAAQDWIVKHQQADGSFEPVGFIHHQDLLGGLKGKPALTAYVAIALQEAGETSASAKAIRYLENALGSLDDPYAVAITTYALELAKSGKAGAAYDKLMSMAHQSEDGLYWGDDQVVPEPVRPEQPGMAPGILPMPRPNESAVIETTAYAALALIEHGDQLTASQATKWLLSKRNALGGFGSTQDTVVGLQALTRFATNAKSDVDATVTLRSGDWQKEVRIDPTNADVLQVIDVPTGGTLAVEAKGKGQIVLQSVRRYNVPDAEQAQLSIFQMNVDYGVDEVEVNDLITVKASIKFTPPEPMEAGMVVMDVAVPTGFAPVTDGIEQLVQREPKLKRYDVAGRKVILYIEDMQPNEELTFTFQAQALYPVKAQAVTSQVYAYYQPEWRGETLAGAMVVR
ncbi:MAG: alpha-2-macroglobulin family protein, partial [Chloroflexota bacterium]